MSGKEQEQASMWMTGFIPDEQLLERVRKMMLLGFKDHEMLEVIEASGVSFTSTELADYMTFLRDGWAARPEVEEINRKQGESFSRTEMFLEDLLGVYHDMLVNYRADMEGKFTHPDGRPVKPVRPTELAGIAEKIAKMESKLMEDRKKDVMVLGANPTDSVYKPPQLTSSSDDDEMDEEIVIHHTRLS